MDNNILLEVVISLKIGISMSLTKIEECSLIMLSVADWLIRKNAKSVVEYSECWYNILRICNFSDIDYIILYRFDYINSFKCNSLIQFRKSFTAVRDSFCKSSWSVGFYRFILDDNYKYNLASIGAACCKTSIILFFYIVCIRFY